MTFALYRGQSLISKLIQGFSRSVYSHVAIDFTDQLGSVYESVSAGFVRASTLWVNHDTGTVVDLFEYRRPLTRVELNVAERTAIALVGQPYDYASVFLNFPLRLDRDGDTKRLFCSEAALAISWSMGEERLLQRMLPWKATPDHIAISPLLKWKGSITL
jgi:hypothetical protein